MSDLAMTAVQRVFDHHDISMPEVTLDAGRSVRLGQLLDNAVKAQNTAEMTYQWSIFNFRPADYTLKKDSEVIRLTEKEAALLEILVKADGQGVSRDNLLRHVWRYAPDVETHTLETHIYRLRQKIEDDPANPAIVVTDGDGYRLNGL